MLEKIEGHTHIPVWLICELDDQVDDLLSPPALGLEPSNVATPAVCPSICDLLDWEMVVPTECPLDPYICDGDHGFCIDICGEKLISLPGPWSVACKHLGRVGSFKTSPFLSLHLSEHRKTSAFECERHRLSSGER